MTAAVGDGDQTAPIRSRDRACFERDVGLDEVLRGGIHAPIGANSTRLDNTPGL